MSFTTQEIFSQPDMWEKAAALPTTALPQSGGSVAVVGCGTSWFIAQSYTAEREQVGRGVSDAFTAVADGIPAEDALKLREAAQNWTESYPTMEYRHRPISIAQEGRLVWVFGPFP